MLSFTKKSMVRWGGRRKFVEGENLYKNSLVTRVEYDPPYCSGEICRGERTIRTRFKILKDGAVEPLCPCYESTQRGVVCIHVIALGLALIARKTDPERGRKAEEELRHARRMQNYDESDYIQRTTEPNEKAIPAKLKLALGAAWENEVPDGMIPVETCIESDKQSWDLDSAPREQMFRFSKRDEALLFVLEDIAEGPAPARTELTMHDFVNVLNLLKKGRIWQAGNNQEIVIASEPAESVLHVDLNRETGELLLRIRTMLPSGKPAISPLYCITNRSGWIYAENMFRPLENVLPPPLREVYRRDIAIPRESVPRFMHQDLPTLQNFMKVETELSADLLQIEPAEPRFCLRIKGSPASLKATFFAVYGDDLSLVAGREESAHSFALPDEDDLLKYYVRNVETEREALEELELSGFIGRFGDQLAPIVGCREVLNFMGRELPKLNRRGWRCEMEGAIAKDMENARFAVPVVHVNDTRGGKWFEVNYEFDDGTGESLSQAEIYTALQKGDSYIQKNGRVTLLDAQAIEDLAEVFRDCSRGEGQRRGSFKVPAVYSAYVKSSLDTLDGVDVEAPREWLRDAERKYNKSAPAKLELGHKLESILRSYQKEGVDWMRSLEQCGFCGILADEMGLGKTLQTLVWLQSPRLLPAARSKPALVVCPTSLVDNWIEETRKFMPDLQVLKLTGSDRHERREHIDSVDLGITSYAILRRDIDFYEKHSFGSLVLDEAQHIKNHSTQNALSAKRIDADNRMVLTGTPIENGVSDIWSIMDFLMPGYLGSHKKFRRNYERRIAAMGRDGQIAQQKLRRKLAPFLLRRTKQKVAKELPEKIEKVAYCELTLDQQRVYKEIAERERRRLTEMVEREGFDKSRMEVLKVLLRLRQICCHLDLLQLEDLNSEYPSAKMDLFFELLDEAVDGGHRVLVFSQFVSMLTILRQELEERETPYCYLDGSSKNRMEIVKRFNTDRSIPVFLISLKAGGVGLNLTGADMVVHFDPWWNPAVENQATDRAHRIGQKNTVYSLKMITKGTVEEKVLEMQERKKRLIDATISEGGDIISKLTWEEVKELF